MIPDLQRFLEAQEQQYKVALSEIISGYKQSHWMWYIFPQIAGLGFSETSKYYAIKNPEEAIAYLKHNILGTRLLTITEALLQLKENNATAIFGTPDDRKLQSCMTLFELADEEQQYPAFGQAIEKYFQGKRDLRTVAIWEEMK